MPKGCVVAFIWHMNAAPSGHLVYLNLSLISVLQSLSHLSMEVEGVKLGFTVLSLSNTTFCVLGGFQVLSGSLRFHVARVF